MNEDELLAITLSGPQGCGKTRAAGIIRAALFGHIAFVLRERGNHLPHPLSDVEAVQAFEDKEALRAKAEELDKIAAMVGEADDPFAAWESLALIITQHGAMLAALAEARENLYTAAGNVCTSEAERLSCVQDIDVLLAETPELKAYTE